MVNIHNRYLKMDCPMIRRAVTIAPGGAMSPCCYNKDGVNKTSFEEYLQSDFYKQFKKTFKRNMFPADCKKCRDIELSGAKSKRQIEVFKFYNKHGHLNFDFNDELDIIDLRISNLCNQACVFCNPANSSMIQTEVEIHNENHTWDNYDLSQKLFVENCNDFRRTLENEEIFNIIDKLSYGGRVYFAGGEPSIIKQVYDILEYLISTGRNEDVYLEFNSNFHSFNPKFISYLKKFKGLMMVSIDAIEDEYNYIRHHGIWEKTKTNILDFQKELPNFEIRLCPASFILNVYANLNLTDWALENNIKIEHMNMLTRPPWLDMRLLSKALRKNIIKTIHNKYFNTQVEWEDHCTFMASEFPGKGITLLDTEKNLDKMDKIRKTSWRNMFPFLVEEIEQYKRKVNV